MSPQKPRGRHSPFRFWEKGGEHDWESGHGLCPCGPERWKSATMAIPISIPEGMKEGGHDLCPSLLGK